MNSKTTTDAGSSAGKAQKKNGATVKNIREIKFDKGLFIGGVAGYLRSMEPPAIPFDGEYAKEPALEQAVEMMIIYYGKELEDFGDAVTALAAFKQWLDDTDWHYQKPLIYNINNITVTLGMTVPSGTLTVSMNVDDLVGDPARVIREVKDELQAALSAAFAGTIERRRPLPETEKPNRNSKAKSDEPQYETEEVHVTGMRVKKYENKWYWNLMPDEGKWQQYGIPLYSDVAKKFDVKLPQESGEYDIDWIVTYELKEDGKPRRVIEIDNANSGDD